MKQQLSPKVAVIAIAVIVLLLVGFGWKMVTRPQQAHIVFHGGDTGDNLPANVQHIKRFGQAMLQTGRSPDSNTAPATPGGQ